MSEHPSGFVLYGLRFDLGWREPEYHLVAKGETLVTLPVLEPDPEPARAPGRPCL